MRGNPYTQVSVRYWCHSPVPSGQFVRNRETLPLAVARGPNRNNSSGHTRPSPLHGIVNASVIALGILLAGGVLLTASCWGPGAASRSARILLIAGAAGSVMVGLVPVSRVCDHHLDLRRPAA